MKAREQFALTLIVIALFLSIISMSNYYSRDYSVTKPNYYGLTLMNIIPNSYPCIYEQRDLYESTGVSREYLGTKYLILVNKLTGDTCPVEI